MVIHAVRHQSQRACEGWLAVFPCVSNWETVMDFSIDYISSYLACTCIRVEVSWVSSLNIQSYFIHYNAYNKSSIWKETLYHLKVIIMTTHWTHQQHPTSLLLCEVNSYRADIFTFSLFCCPDLLKMASHALLCTQIHHVRRRTSVSVLQTTWCLWAFYWEKMKGK